MPGSLPVSRRRVLSAVALGVAGVASPAIARPPARSPRPPQRPAGALIEVPARAGAAPVDLARIVERSGVTGQTAVIALDAQTGAVIEAHRANLLLPPASTAKAITALYALSLLGHEHRFVTQVETRGATAANGTLHGDLILRGGGDPSLQTADLARLADAVVATGLRRVEGRLVVDDTALPRLARIDRDQPAQAGYNPGISGINLNFNRVNFVWEVRRGRASLSMDARSNRETPPVSVIDIEAVARDWPVYTHETRGGGEHWTVAASALGRAGSRWLPVRHPGRYAGDVFRALLRVRGCTVPAPRVEAAPRATVLAQHQSETLAEITRAMLRYSTNLTAECTGLAASLRQGRAAGSLADSAARMNRWAAEVHGARGLDLIDHSGLGDGSRVSPRAMATYFRSALAEGNLAPLLHPARLTDLAGREVATLLAKTGTMDFVSALTGVVQPRSGRSVVFSIISADMARRRAIPDQNIERPPGTRRYTTRGRELQSALLRRWASGTV